MSRKARPSSIPRSIEAFTDTTSRTTEETDCERRGYKLTRTVLGSGAYAKVKLAYATTVKLDKDRRLAEHLREKGHNKVAVKIISRKTAPVEYINKFMPREIDTLNAVLGCPNVIQLYETFRTESRVYLVMEFASNGDLLEYINSRSCKIPGVGETLARKFFRQLITGLGHCHRRNVVHRDLKCENILLEEGDIIKISDFGFATRFPTNKQRFLETFCGSYAYAAPEILQAEKYDGKVADVWSLGVILFAMLNGRLPFNDKDIHTLIAQTKGLLRFSSRVELSLECQDLIKKILNPDPKRRISINEISHHQWMQHSSSDEWSSGMMRGIPDGKSEDLLSKMQDTDLRKEEQPFSRNAPSYLTRVLHREKWMTKAPEPTAMAKLLHSRLSKTSQREKQSDDCSDSGSNPSRYQSPFSSSKEVERRQKSGKSKAKDADSRLSNYSNMSQGTVKRKPDQHVKFSENEKQANRVKSGKHGINQRKDIPSGLDRCHEVTVSFKNLAQGKLFKVLYADGALKSDRLQSTQDCLFIKSNDKSRKTNYDIPTKILQSIKRSKAKGATPANTLDDAISLPPVPDLSDVKESRKRYHTNSLIPSEAAQSIDSRKSVKARKDSIQLKKNRCKLVNGKLISKPKDKVELTFYTLSGREVTPCKDKKCQ